MKMARNSDQRNLSRELTATAATAGLAQKKNWTVTELLWTPSTLPARLFLSVILASSWTTQKKLAIRTLKNTAPRSEKTTERLQSSARTNSTREKTIMATAKETFANATKRLRIILLQTLRLSTPKTGSSLKVASTTTNVKSPFLPLLVSSLDHLMNAAANTQLANRSFRSTTNASTGQLQALETSNFELYATYWKFFMFNEIAQFWIFHDFPTYFSPSFFDKKAWIGFFGASIRI